MERRQDRYSSEEPSTPKMTRVRKNQSLYSELNNKIGYEEITSFDSGTEIDLSALNNDRPRREEYQKIKEYKNIMENDEEEIEKKDYRTESKPKVFDINEALEAANRNRKEDDELEKKRKLSGDESVLSSLNKKYLHNKDFSEQDSEELTDLINTITSKTLVDDVSDTEEGELLSDLLATTIDIKLEQELSNEEINKLYGENTLSEKDLKKDEIDETIDETLDETLDTSKLDNSFFTHSVELKKEDLLDDEEKDEDEEDEEDGTGIGKIIIIVVIILAIILLLTYLALKIFGF